MTWRPIASTLAGLILSIVCCSAQPLPPTLTKAFGAAVINVGGTTTLNFTVANPNTSPLTNVQFSDTLPAGLVSTGFNGVLSCPPGTGVNSAGPITFSSTLFPGNASCTFSINVKGTSAGLKVNTTTTITSTESSPGPPASAAVNVGPVVSPTITKAFADAQLQMLGAGDSTTLSFTITNPAGNPIPLTGLAFTDTLPSGLIVSSPNGLTGSCGGGTITAIAGSNSISLSGATLAAGASCNFSVNVTGTEIGVQTNTTSTVTSNEAPPGAPAMASISVDASFFQWFFLESGGGGQHP
jgi:uncharacterized repeat protein (TIGR01451 family)